MKRRTAPVRAVFLTPADCTADGRETIEHFIARGGRIEVIPPPPPAPSTAAPVREPSRQGTARRMAIGGC